MKMKWSGGAAQINCVPCAALLTLVILSSNSVPDPESGVKSFEKADMRSVLIGPVPGRTFPDTFQLPPVSPAFCTGSLWKVTTLSSKVKSPWNPTSLFFASMVVVVTLDNEVGNKCVDGDIRKGERSYRSRNLTGTRAIICRSL